MATRRTPSARLTGFGQQIWRRLAAVRSEVVEASGTPGAELVLASRFDQAYAVAQEAAGGKIRVHGARKVDPDGVRAGAAAANGADIGLSRVGGANRRALR